MKNCVLGISCFGHDTSASIVDEKDGQVIFASAQERYSNIKFDDNIPLFTINECIKTAQKFDYNIKYAAIASDHKLFLGNYFFKEIKKVLNKDDITNEFINFLKTKAINFGYYNKFLKKNFEIDNYISNNFSHVNYHDLNRIKDLVSWYFNWSIKHLKIKKIIQSFIKDIKIYEIEHHLCHAASAYYNSGYNSSNIVVFDGQGEDATVSLYSTKENNFSLIGRTYWPHSIGILYLKGTEVLGYSLGDEYKVMGMSAYGKNSLDYIFNKSYNIDDQGKLKFISNKFIKFQDIENTAHSCINFTEEVKKILPKQINKNFKQVHFDFAKTLQNTVEKIGYDLSDFIYQKTKIKNLCLSGGVALNGLMNNKILNSNNYDDVFVYPASGDDGTSVGAAQYMINKNIKIKSKKIKTCFLGFSEENAKIKDNFFFKNNYLEKINCSDIAMYIANKIHENNVVAVFNNKSEFGPRALGARSIIANPTIKNIVEILNTKIKLREPFRPFAPICLKEYVSEYFNIKTESNFMLFICDTKDQMKNLIPGVVHNDGTARVQSVDEENKVFYKILTEFHKISGVPILINTSFNIGGEAIVNSIDDAINSYFQMDIDFILINDELYKKNLKKLENFKKPNIKKFIDKRQSNFKNINKFGQFNITNYNHNFFINWGSQFKQLIKEKIKKNYI